MSYKPGHIRSKETIEKQRQTLIATLRKKREAKKHRNDKTIPTEKTNSVTSPQGVVNPEVGIESNSKKLININLKGEYDKMTETLNPKKENKDGKEKKYQCGECGATFDNLKEGHCPDCGIRLK